jgi:hypothetical protein
VTAGVVLFVVGALAPTWLGVFLVVCALGLIVWCVLLRCVLWTEV